MTTTEYYLVVDCQLNRAYYRQYIGMVLSDPIPYARLVSVPREYGWTRIDWHYIKPSNTVQEKAASQTLTRVGNNLYSDLGINDIWDAYQNLYNPIV